MNLDKYKRLIELDTANAGEEVSMEYIRECLMQVPALLSDLQTAMLALEEIKSINHDYPEDYAEPLVAERVRIAGDALLKIKGGV